MQFGRTTQGTYGMTIVLSSIVAVIAAAVWVLWRPSLGTMILLLLQLEGMALLANGLAPQDWPLNPGFRKRWGWFWDRSRGSVIGFNKVEFWAGLSLLALAAIVAAVAC